MTTASADSPKGGEIVPNINALDPSPRTMDQMSQAINGLKELILVKFAENDKAVVRLQEFANSQPTPGVIYAKLEALAQLTETRFNESEKRTEQTRLSDKGSLDIALTAAKEATGKSEAGFTEQIRTIGSSITTLQSSLEARINDIKERIDRGEGGQTGSKAYQTVLFTIVGLIISAAFMSIALIGFLTK